MRVITLLEGQILGHQELGLDSMQDKPPIHTARAVIQWLMVH
jgi:hypothetical protein